MKRRVSLLLATTGLLAVAIASPLEAAPPPVTAGMTFNIPMGTKAEQLINIRKMMAAIDGTKAGETIRMAFFSLTVQNFSEKLIAAHNRGVNVKLIQDDHEIGAYWQDLVAALGEDTSQRSWAVICHRSCFSDENPSYMHAKIYLFSKTAGKSLVTMVSSANPTYTQARVGWNDMYTIIGDPNIYEGGKRYFEDMTAGALDDRANNQSNGVPIDYYFTAASGKHQLYFFPKEEGGVEGDPMFDMLDDIECIGTAPGYGFDGRTIVKVAMYQWSVRRERLARQLWRLQNQGCLVEVIYDQTVTDKEIIDILKVPSPKYGTVIPLTKSSEDKNGDGDFEHFVDHFNHEKYVLINGIYTGDRSSKVVIAGSSNWTNTALHYGNEITIQIKDNSVYNDYNLQFRTMKAWAKSVPKRHLAPGPFPANIDGGGDDEVAGMRDVLRDSRNEFLPTEWE